MNWKQFKKGIEQLGLVFGDTSYVHDIAIPKSNYNPGNMEMDIIYRMTWEEEKSINDFSYHFEAILRELKENDKTI